MARVLVVEDNAINLELMMALLERERCEVLVAETADVALRLARTSGRVGLARYPVGSPWLCPPFPALCPFRFAVNPSPVPWRSGPLVL
jgi:CheY-like chemotaxis protein